MPRTVAVAVGAVAHDAAARSGSATGASSPSTRERPLRVYIVVENKQLHLGATFSQMRWVRILCSQALFCFYPCLSVETENSLCSPTDLNDVEVILACPVETLGHACQGLGVAEVEHASIVGLVTANLGSQQETVPRNPLQSLTGKKGVVTQSGLCQKLNGETVRDDGQ